MDYDLGSFIRLPFIAKPNVVVRRSQSFANAFPATKKDFHSSRAADFSTKQHLSIKRKPVQNLKL